MATQPFLTVPNVHTKLWRGREEEEGREESRGRRGSGKRERVEGEES